VYSFINDIGLILAQDDIDNNELWQDISYEKKNNLCNISISNLYKLYKNWCENNGIRFVQQKKYVKSKLISLGLQFYSRIKINNTYYSGFSISTDKLLQLFRKLFNNPDYVFIENPEPEPEKKRENNLDTEEKFFEDPLFNMLESDSD